MAKCDHQKITEAKLKLLYPREEQRADAERILDRYNGDSNAGDFRVRLAALKLAGNDLSELERCINIALIDSRDILARAEYPRQYNAGFGVSDESLERQDLEEYEAWLRIDQA